MPGWKRFLPEILGGYPTNYSDRQAAGTPHCSKYSNAELRKKGIRTVGDAWNRYPDKGYKMQTVIDGFEYTKDQRPKEFNQGKYDQYLSNSADSVAKYLDMAKLQDGDVVSMYYKGSPNGKKAFENGKVAASTHTGHIVIQDGTPYVDHNVNGTVVRNKAEDITGGDHSWGITQIRRASKR